MPYRPADRPVRGQPTPFSLPRGARRLLVSCEAAELAREVLRWSGRLWRSSIEVAFMMWGSPPGPDRPAVVEDVQPMSSISTGWDVVVPPDSALAAWRELDRRNSAGCPLGVSHSHPSPGRPIMSGTDRDWHRDCLDLHPEMVLALPGRGDGGAVLHQVLYQLIYPSTGSFQRAQAYLIARRRVEPLADQIHFEVEIDHEYAEAERARERVAAMAPSMAPCLWTEGVRVTFGDPSGAGADDGRVPS